MNEMIEQYLVRILQENEKINLTNIKDFQEAKLLHIEDSLTALPEMNNAPAGLYGDMGSGGGFPGVPLAVTTGRRTILIDSVKKKMATVSSVLDEMGLSSQISTYDRRIEELAQEQTQRFAVLTARALSSLPSLLELASPLLMKHGRLICLKAHTEDELIRSQKIEEQTGMHFISKRDYYLSDNKTYREIIVFEKTMKPSIKLPRRIGLAQKKPLS